MRPSGESYIVKPQKSQILWQLGLGEGAVEPVWGLMAVIKFLVMKLENEILNS